MPLRYKPRLLIHYFKKYFSLRGSEKAEALHIFIAGHLLKYNARLISENVKSYTSRYFPEDSPPYQMTLRKSPSSDFEVYQQIFEYREFYPLVELIRKNHKGANDIALKILDAGGNIGATSVFFNNFFPQSEFLIVEPDEDNFNSLKKNIQQNNILNSTLIKGAVWHKSAHLEICRNFRDGKDWSVQVIEANGPTDLIGFDIPSLMQKANYEIIDILKIDVEGSEKQIFSDEDKAAEFLAKTRYIAIEIHDDVCDRNEINECLRKNKFSFFTSGQLTIGLNMNLSPDAVL